MNFTNGEIEVAQKLSHGNDKAFRDIFENYWELLHNIAFNRVQSSATADDLVKNVFTELRPIDVLLSMKYL